MNYLDASLVDGAFVVAADVASVHIHDVAFVDAVDVALVHIVGGAFEVLVDVNAYLKLTTTRNKLVCKHKFNE